MSKEGDKLRDKGIQLALFNAEMKNPGWKNKALSALTEYIRIYPNTPFQAEEVRLWAYRKGLPEPPTDRAWGAVIRAAKKKKLIQFAGYRNVSNPRAHSTPASVWEKC